MSFLIKSAVLCLVLLSIFTSRTSAQTTETSSKEDGTLTRALLYEVRELRIVIQETNAYRGRIQIAIERVRIQQERVDRVSRDLEQLRDQIAELKIGQTRLAELIKEAEHQARQETFPVRRQELDKQIRAYKLDLDLLMPREVRYRDKEVQLNSLVHLEQAKLAELTERLDAIDKEMEGQAKEKKRKP